jgi:hypothetical protein
MSVAIFLSDDVVDHAATNMINYVVSVNLVSATLKYKISSQY